MKDINLRRIVIGGIIVGILMIIFAFAFEGGTNKALVEVIKSKSICEEQHDIVVLYKQQLDGFNGYIYIFHDDKRNVTCWKIAGGFSCIPDHLLEERRKD